MVFLTNVFAALDDCRKKLNREEDIKELYMWNYCSPSLWSVRQPMYIAPGDGRALGGAKER